MLRTLSLLCLTIIILQLAFSQTSSICKHTQKKCFQIKCMHRLVTAHTTFVHRGRQNIHETKVPCSSFKFLTKIILLRNVKE